MSTDPAPPLPLPARLDGLAAESLVTTLKGLQGHPLSIDGGSVTTVGTLGIQALVAAHRAWRSDGVPYVLDPISDALRSASSGLGIPIQELGVDLQEQVIP